MTKKDALIGCILGTAIGDALGLPYEGLSRQRAAKMLGEPDRYRFFFGHRMVSDDTEHTCFVAIALIVSGGDVDKFRASLAWQLRWWLTTVPAGIGLATLRAILKLWAGVSPVKSGVFSAGNGPAMRAAILGVAVEDQTLMYELVSASSTLTHTDPKATWGALAVSLAAKFASSGEYVDADEYLGALKSVLPPEASEFVVLMEKAVASMKSGESTQSFADSMGLSRGVSGYVYHTVPVAIHAWVSNQNDYFEAVRTIIRCGGDADSTAAIVGGIVGARVGKAGLPENLVEKMFETPRRVKWMEMLAENLASNSDKNQLGGAINFLVIYPRNFFFVAVVLLHGFRRLAPPY